MWLLFCVCRSWSCIKCCCLVWALICVSGFAFALVFVICLVTRGVLASSLLLVFVFWGCYFEFGVAVLGWFDICLVLLLVYFCWLLVWFLWILIVGLCFVVCYLVSGVMLCLLVGLV